MNNKLFQKLVEEPLVEYTKKVKLSDVQKIELMSTCQDIEENLQRGMTRLEWLENIKTV